MNIEQAANPEMALLIKNLTLTVTVCIGSAPIWMGYSLFRKGIMRPSEAMGEGAGYKIHFVNVGPGIFFAAFGVIIIAMALNKL